MRIERKDRDTDLIHIRDSVAGVAPVLLWTKSSTRPSDTAWAMSEENVEHVRRGLEALDRRDRSAWLALSDEDLEVVPSRDWPESGVRGPEAAFDWYLQAFDSLQPFPTTDTEFIDAGADKVLLQYRMDLRGKASGAKVEWRRWCVVTMRKGRGLRHEWFTDRADAHEAAGLSE
jgi:ketosteroid isomerase-like protein